MNVKIILLYLIMGALFFSVITTGLFGLTILASSTARTLYVPDNYASIQEAIDAAQVGDTIKVRAGLYYENLIVYKPITIQGEDRTSTTIQGDGTSATVWIQANNLVVSGFTIKNAGEYYSSISIGMYWACKNITICENIIKNTVEGITVWWNSSYVTISRNTISGCDCGIGIDNSTDNTISGNVLTDNTHAVMMTYCDNNTITENTFKNNEHSGMDNDSCYNNTVVRNNFINSPVDIDETVNIWDDGSMGNYYSNYGGKDLNGDGIGDLPNQIDASNQDNFPLMEPWSLVRTYDAFVWNERTYKVNIQTDSIVAAFNFTYSLRQISFNITGCKGEAGFCNVTVPNLLLIGKPWQVRIDGTSISFNKVENETHTSLYFALTFSTHMIKIAGTQALEKIPPHADAGSDQIVKEGTKVTFDGSRSTDNIGITNYTWTFVDETPKILVGIFSTYTFNRFGNYTVTLTVMDAVGNMDTDTVTITVLEVPKGLSLWPLGLLIAIVIVILLAIVWWKRRSSSK